MPYEFSGETFRHFDKITNEMVIGAYELEAAAEPSWIMNREALPKMMRIILDGPHDKIDWMQQEMKLCKQAYQDFFQLVAQKATE